MNRGKWVILAIFGLATALAIVAWNQQRQRGRRVLEYFGYQDALRIRLAPQVDLWELPAPQNAVPSRQELTELLAGRGMTGVRHINLSAKPGWVHARQALIEDHSYDWTVNPVPPASWTHLFRFHDRGQDTWLLLDARHGLVRLLARERPLAFGARVSKGFRIYLQDVLPAKSEGSL